ncbi:hypothetical protein GRAN_3044 [Granulicella sibirica]|uniref:Uncharacterized protein n=1 Tax=Granulicella sibirica TaxID=2479048 RepID=A0A4Q0SZ93_9BACT|nr:hypothetical protein GRAN_3044 [Granulicella sibirica]
MGKELIHHAHGAHQIDLYFAGNVLMGKIATLKVDFTHNASVVDENIQRRKLCRYVLVEGCDRRSITHIALDCVYEWMVFDKSFQLSSITTGDDHGISKGLKLNGKSEPDAGRASCQQNCIARHIHRISPYALL